MTEREVEKEEVVEVEEEEEEEEKQVEEVEVTLRLATGKKSMSSPPAHRRTLALSPLSRSTQPSATSTGQNKRTRIHDP